MRARRLPEREAAIAAYRSFNGAAHLRARR